MDIGKNVKDARKRAQLSQEALARQAGISVSAVAQIEQGGRTDPHYSTLSKLAKGLGISVGDLLDSPKAEASTSATSREVEDSAQLRKAQEAGRRAQLEAEAMTSSALSDETGEARRTRPFEMVRELVIRQSEEDSQAIARAAESSFPQVSFVRHENEARDRLWEEYHPADVAEAYVGLVKGYEQLRQENEERYATYLEVFKDHVARRAAAWSRHAEKEDSLFFADWRTASAYTGEVVDEAFMLTKTATKKLSPAIEKDLSPDFAVCELEALIEAVKDMLKVVDKVKARSDSALERAAQEDLDHSTLEEVHAEEERIAQERRAAFELVEGVRSA